MRKKELILTVFYVFASITPGILIQSRKYEYNRTWEMENEFLYDSFPHDFLWGFATSSYQVEGGWNEGGKGLSIWDTFVHRENSNVNNNATGDIACDSYHKYKADVAFLKEYGADYYRFSISWARILPNGTEPIEHTGIDYYNNLIDELEKNGIKSMATMYHWDLPQALEDIGGWRNERMADYFADYARVLFEHFGDRVKLWLTFNEPWVFCMLGYGNVELAPGLVEPSDSHYSCIHNVLKAHANAYHIYNDSFKPTQLGKCGITLDTNWPEPKNASNPQDIDAADRQIQFSHAWMGSPLYHGDYPTIMREMVDEKSAKDLLVTSRLPTFDSDWIEKIKGSLDFLGLNHYSTDLIEYGFSNSSSWWSDRDVTSSVDPLWEGSISGKHIVPWGMRRLLNWIKDTYGNPELYITENGYADPENGTTEDPTRTRFYREYINEVLKAIKLDNCNVKSYTAWSLLDNFEWTPGYSQRFGVTWVNFSDPERTRIPKQSALSLKQIIGDHGFPNTATSILSNFTVVMPLLIHLVFRFV